MTDQTLTKERNFFLAGFFALVAIGAVFRLGALSEPPDAVENVQRLGAVLTLLAKLVFVYLVFRLSLFESNGMIGDNTDGGRIREIKLLHQFPKAHHILSEDAVYRR